MIFPELGPQYYNEPHKAILSKMEASYAQAITINQAQWAEADTDLRFECNDQSVWNDYYGNLPANRRRQFTFNRIRRVVNMIGGYQRRNRKSSLVIPVENGDAETADQFTKILMWNNQQEGVLETISDAFHGAVVTGMNLLQVWMDYREDPVSGNIKVDNCSYNSFLIDPFFKKHDLSDCNFLWKRSYLTKREAISLLPDFTEEIMKLHGNDSGNGRDGKFQFQPESYNWAVTNLLTYDEYYYRDYRTQKMIVDTQTGETMEWKSNKTDEQLREFLRREPTLTVIEQDVPTVNLAIVIQGRVFYDGPNPLGIDCYPFVPVYAYYNPQLPYYPDRIQGVVRGLRDAQYLYNRRRIIELDILESQISSGWIYKENAVVNTEDLLKLQGPGRVVALKQESQMTDIQPIVAPAVPPSMIQLSELLAKEVSEISGVSEELLGSASDDVAGVLSMLRQGAGLTTLQILFDNLDRSQKLLDKIRLDLIQANFTPGKVKKILEGEEPKGIFYNKEFGKYHIAVEEGMNTATQKQMQFAQLMELKKIGVMIPDTVILEAATLQKKKELVDSIQQSQQQQQQMAQQQAQLQMAELQSRIDLANARAKADEGLGYERLSRVEENRALALERQAKAHHDEDSALLEKIKALKELEDLDINHLERLVNLANSLKEPTIPVQGERGIRG